MSSGDFVSESKPQFTRGKLMLIGTLASTLIGVLWQQFSGEDEPKPGHKGGKAAHAPANPGPTAVASRGNPEANAAAKKEVVKPFPEISQEETLQHDPFALSEAFAKKQSTSEKNQTAESEEALRKQEEQKKHQTLRQQALNKLLEQGVAVVVRGDNGPAATIGTRLVHEGDTIDGFRVDRIDTDGVILKEAPLP